LCAEQPPTTRHATSTPYPQSCDVAQSAAPLSFRALLEIADPSRILFGTDYPFARNAEKVLKDTIEALARFDGFDDTLRRKIAFDNARTLFPRFANPETDIDRTTRNPAELTEGTP